MRRVPTIHVIPASPCRSSTRAKGSGATRKSQRGFSLIVVLLLSLAALGLGMLSAASARTELRIAHNDVLSHKAFNAAEAGMNAALKVIGNHSVLNDELASNSGGTCSAGGAGNASSGLATLGSAASLASDGLCYRFVEFGGSAPDGYYVRVEDNLDETVGGDDPLVDTDGAIRVVVHGVAGTAERIIVASVRFSPGWGMFGINSVTMTGGSTVDGGVGSSNSWVGSNGTITLSGSPTHVYGSASAGGTVSTSGGAWVTVSTITGAPTQTFDAVPACGPSYSGSAGITLGSHADYNPATGALSSSGGSTITLAPGTYCISSLSLSGNSTLIISGATTINVTGGWDSSGGSVSNTTNDPNNLKVNSSGTANVKLSGGSSTYMKVYAPAADIDISGGSTIWGSIIGKTITASGGTTIHQMGTSSSAAMSAWHEVQN